MTYRVRTIEAESDAALEEVINEMAETGDIHPVAVLRSAMVERGPEYMSRLVPRVTFLMWEDSDE